MEDDRRRPTTVQAALAPVKGRAGMFRLTKWYFDVCTRDGSAFIGYAARLRRSRLRLRFSSILLSTPDHPVRERFTLRRTSVPLRSPDGIRWDCDRLAVEGLWRSRVPAVRRRLFDGADGVIEWACFAPAADAFVRVADRCLSGTGYVERLRMTLPPWRLPIETLRWGRFIGRSTSIVWIDWAGNHPLQLVLLNGRDATPGARIEGDSLSIGDGRLVLDTGTSRTLRAGPLSDVLGSIPALGSLLPERLAGALESKWLTRGAWRAEGLPAESGPVIHEVVQWPPASAV